MDNSDLTVLVQCLEKIGYTIDNFEAGRGDATFTISKKTEEKK